MDKKVAVITGGSNGYGMGLAEILAETGDYEIVIMARNQERTQKVANLLRCNAFVGDITIQNDWSELRKYVMDCFGRIDILVNNAGSGIVIAPLVEQTLEEIHNSLKLNLLGCILGCHTFAQDMMKAQSGLIINVTSVCATKAWPGFSVYSACKSGMRMFTKCLQTELQPYNVRCTTVIPGSGHTDFGVNAGLPADQKTIGLYKEDMGKALYSIIEMPSRLLVEEYVLWGIDQRVIPM